MKRLTGSSEFWGAGRKWISNVVYELRACVTANNLELSFSSITAVTVLAMLPEAIAYMFTCVLVAT